MLRRWVVGSRPSSLITAEFDIGRNQACRWCVDWWC